MSDPHQFHRGETPDSASTSKALCRAEQMKASKTSCRVMQATPELTDAGGQWRPNWNLTQPARVRSSNFVRHHRTSSGSSIFEYGKKYQVK
jgi:hypothetical protein